MSELPPPDRTSHPFWTYDMIKEIPTSFDAALMQAAGIGLPRRERIVFTGNGTAFFSAWMGSQVLAGLGVAYEAIQSFELEHYTLTTGKDVVVGVSHSGITKSTVDSLRKARGTGAFTVGVTHFDGRPLREVCDATLVIGNGPDKSRCHTKTYVDSAVAVAKIGLGFARASGRDVTDVETLLANLGKDVARVTAESEDWAKRLVDGLPELNQVVFVGAGPNVVTAREAALKIKEACYLPSEVIELEEEMHGPWNSIDGSSLVVLVAPRGPSTARAKDLVDAAQELGATTVVIGDRSLDAHYSFALPAVIERLTPFVAIVPLYFVAYFLSVKLGHNPDYLRYLEPKYWEARKKVFPPGTH